jgi:hypothetical protein
MSPHEAYLICLGRKRRSPDLEEIISTDFHSSYVYARDIIKGPFKKGEKIISTDIHHSYHYAVNVTKTAFPLCHPYIFNSPYKEPYIKFLKSIGYDLNEISEWLI